MGVERDADIFGGSSAMRATVTFLALLTLASPVQASRDCDLETLKSEIRWCLVEGPIDIGGRDRMVEALNRDGSPTDIFHFRVGYADCYARDQEKLRNFLECRGADPIVLFNFGRQLIELPPISDGS
ncbi:MAG TPA: hypothetical protein VHG92_06515 [Afifellaceae bacterium]|nr:hypothetical protein [Afifellaceae bacterium]